MEKTIAKIEADLRQLCHETMIGNENLLKRSAFFIELEKLIKDLRLHTQRRLTGKAQTNPSAQLDLFFQKFHSLLEGALK